MEERKYFDYELAYNGYLDFRKTFEKCGRDLVELEKYYDTDYDINDEDLVNIPYHIEENNCTIEINKELDGSLEVSNLVSVFSYGGCDDLIDFDNIEMIKERIENLNNWSSEHNYSFEDYTLEKESLKKVIEDMEDNRRFCSKCGKEMEKGYYNEDEYTYYCSEKCLHEDYTEEEYTELYDNGNGNFYYTEWED